MFIALLVIAKKTPQKHTSNGQKQMPQIVTHLSNEIPLEK